MQGASCTLDVAITILDFMQLPAHMLTSNSSKQAGTGKTRDEEQRNGKWEMMEMGNDRNGKQEMKNGRNFISSKHSATELAVTMKSQANLAEGRISCF